MKIGSLFSGIGGLELGLEWAGVGRTVWQVEQSAFCRGVLAKHWPDAVRFNDVREVGAHNLPPVDVLCGGPPCQDISFAGRGGGLDGERSGLWWEFARIIAETRPRWVVFENVAALETRDKGAWRDAILGWFRANGYRGERSVVSACSVGASHPRARLFIVAHATGQRQQESRVHPQDTGHQSAGHDWEANRLVDAIRRSALPFLCREDHGIPGGMDRLTALGNAVVPQVAEVAGRRLLEIDAALDTARAGE